MTAPAQMSTTQEGRGTVLWGRLRSSSKKKLEPISFSPIPAADELAEEAGEGDGATASVPAGLLTPSPASRPTSRSSFRMIGRLTMSFRSTPKTPKPGEKPMSLALAMSVSRMRSRGGKKHAAAVIQQFAKKYIFEPNVPLRAALTMQSAWRAYKSYMVVEKWRVLMAMEADEVEMRKLQGVQKETQRKLKDTDRIRGDRRTAERKAAAAGVWDAGAVHAAAKGWSQFEVAKMVAIHVVTGDPKSSQDWQPYEKEFSKRSLKDIKKKFNKLKRDGDMEKLELLEDLDEETLGRLIPSWDKK